MGSLTLDPELGSMAKRKEKFEKLILRFTNSDSEIRKSVAGIMERFKPGLFVGNGFFEQVRDNQDLERFFKLPKSHERKIHGRRHAGIRIVVEGPTLLPTLNAHQFQEIPFKPSDLLPYSKAVPPKSQQESVERKKTMRKATSLKARKTLLDSLEKLYSRCF